MIVPHMQINGHIISSVVQKKTPPSFFSLTHIPYTFHQNEQRKRDFEDEEEELGSNVCRIAELIDKRVKFMLLRGLLFH
jgi:hypothetical protein